MRYTGQISPYIPPSAPLSYRLPERVYAMDGTCSCQNGVGDDYGDGKKLLFVVGVGALILGGLYFWAK